MADEKKDKKTSEGSTDFFLNFMKKRREQEPKKEEPQEKEKRVPLKNSVLDSVYAIIDAINHVIEDILMDDRKSKWLSLVMAAILFITVNGSSITATSERTVEDIPVSIVNLDENYAVTGMPDKVTLKLTGNVVNLQSAVYKGDYSAYIDFNGYSEGTYTMDIKVKGLSGGITAVVSPGSASVTLSPKESRVFALSYKYINEDQKDAKYVLEPPVLSKSEVTVTAGRETLDAIKYVQAVIDVKQVNASFTQKATVKAFDEYNNELQVDVEPATVDVSVSVTSSSQQVPVKVNRVGTMDDSLAIASITPSVTTAMIYGAKENLENVKAIYASVDVSQIYENKEVYGVPIELPSGVNSASIDTINVSIVVENRISKTINDAEIKVLNNTANRKVDFNSVITVSVSGAASKIYALDSSVIQATIDINGLEPGEYEIPVTLKSTDSLLDVKLLSEEKVKVKIE